MEYITPEFSTKIKQVVSQVFSILNDNHKQILNTYLIDIIDIIAVKFNFDPNNKSLYEKQFTQNNSRDIKGLLLILLPYIDDELGNKKKQIASLNDIYTEKKESSIQDINKGEPLYKYSNIQYNRCKRNGTTNASEISFDETHVKHNYELLKDSIQIIAHKLYINWIDVRPLSMLDYQESDLYKITQGNKFNLDDKSYRGLYVGDFYNTFANYLYEEVKKVKWLMYDATDPSLMPYLEYLKLKGLVPDTLLKDISWQETPYKSSFANSWASLRGDTSETAALISKTMTVFFDRWLGNRTKPGYIKLDIKKLDDEDHKIYEISDNKSNISKASLKAEHLYEYMQLSINLFKNTWYGRQLIKDNVITKFTKYPNTTIKNIYNFAKSLTHSKSNFKPYPRQWRALSNSEKSEVITKLNSDTPDWFNISSYLRKIRNIPNDEVNNKNREIYKSIKDNTSNIVFEVLITNGILSQFIPNAAISDNSNYEDDTYQSKTKKIGISLSTSVINKNRSKWNNAFYFMTNTTYEDMPLINFKDGSGAYQSMSYLDQMADHFGFLGSWNTTYAMNWISQISFFHRYLNNRVIYVTGSTGVGKSTQIPKLLMYSLKMIDYKSVGKVVCTQPRITPTTDNATTISKQMGIPILEESSTCPQKKTPSNNYYIQYKYSGGNHIAKINNLSLKIVTDGTLYEELKSSPTLKDNNTNLYDIVIVDEAHEHNKNMDLILTMMKYAAYHNNDTKLIIISATMDEDEPVYRRYYRDINDNKMNPSNTHIEDNLLDRINVDRRIHISPPGESTRFKIEDIYKSGEDADNLVIKIVNESNEGDILYFQPGQAEINRSIENLNKQLPGDTIAVPFYGKLEPSKRKFIEGIATNKSELTIPKSQNYGEDYDEVDIQRVPKGTYKRVVIIATNVAEASITINTLKYVVDTGIQRVMEYDYETGESKLLPTSISESSRIQRRGRIGRVADGTVYYLYKEGSMEKNKTRFNFSVSDVSIDFYALLRNKKNEPEYETPDQSSLYLGQPSQYDYSNNKPPKTYYQTGYDKDTLEDKDGTFWIVHPDELCIIRNIIGTIVEVNKGDTLCDLDYSNNKINSKKIESFWKSLQDKFLIYYDNDQVGKTQYGGQLSALQSELKLPDIRQVISYLYARAYGVGTEVLSTIVMMNGLNGKLNTMFKEFTPPGREYKMHDMENGRSLYGSDYGDTHGISIITNRILNIPQLRVSLRNLDTSYTENSNKDANDIKKINEIQELEDNLKSIIRTNDDYLRSWSDSNYLNYDKVKNFLEFYYKTLKSLNSIDKKKVDLNWFNDRIIPVPKYKAYSSKDPRKITVSFLHGFGLNIMHNISCTDLYMPIKNPSPDNVNKISKTGRSLNTLLNKSSFSEYMPYLYFDDRNGFSIINRVVPDMIQNTVPFSFSPLAYTPERYQLNRNKEAIEHLITSLDICSDTKKTEQLTNTLVPSYLSSLKTIKRDMINNYTPDVYTRLESIDDSHKFKEYLQNQIKDHLEQKRSMQTGGSRTPLTLDKNSITPLVKYIIKRLYK